MGVRASLRYVCEVLLSWLWLLATLRMSDVHNVFSLRALLSICKLMLLVYSQSIS